MSNVAVQLARATLKEELYILVSHIRAYEQKASGEYLSSELARLLRDKKRQATLLNMATAYFNGRVHIREWNVPGVDKVFRFRKVADQAKFLNAVIDGSVFPVLSRRQSLAIKRVLSTTPVEKKRRTKKFEYVDLGELIKDVSGKTVDLLNPTSNGVKNGANDFHFVPNHKVVTKKTPTKEKTTAAAKKAKKAPVQHHTR